MNLIQENFIIINEDIANYEEAIQKASDLLIENGYVKEGYAEMVIDREKVFPTGLKSKTIAIAIPHTDPTLVNKPAIVVTIPKEPVSFREMGSENSWLECEIIFSLVIKDTSKQMDMLRKMMKLLNDTEVLEAVKDSKSKSEIKRLLDDFNI